MSEITKPIVNDPEKRYTEKDVLDPREALTDYIDATVTLLSDYVSYAVERGVRLPKKFATDPAAWAVVLRDIEYAFGTIGMNESSVKIDYNRRSRGFSLFSEYFNDLYETESE